MGWQGYGPHEAITELESENTRLRVRAEELKEALFKLHAWGRPFIGKGSPISAETLWREFPRAMEEASVVLAKTQKGQQP